MSRRRRRQRATIAYRLLFFFFCLFLGWTFGRAQVSFISVSASFACVRVCGVRLFVSFFSLEIGEITLDSFTPFLDSICYLIRSFPRLLSQKRHQKCDLTQTL
jgi:hypothetical protein